MPVVVDTDLGGDDLVALAFLLRHPGVRVEAITIAATGLVGCDPGVDLVADLFTALRRSRCRSRAAAPTPGPTAAPFPADWRDSRRAGDRASRGLAGTLAAVARPAPELIADLAGHDRRPCRRGARADDQPGRPRRLPRRPGYARLAGMHAMGGSVDGPAVDGVAEWNVAADPAAFAAVLAAAVPLTVVPEDAIPDGTPDALVRPGRRRRRRRRRLPEVVGPRDGGGPGHRGRHVETGRWVSEPSEPGRLRRDGAGSVRVVRSLDAGTLDAEYARVFAAHDCSGSVARPPPRTADGEHEPGDWMQANRIRPSALNVGPVNSLSLSSLRASG